MRKILCLTLILVGAVSASAQRLTHIAPYAISQGEVGAGTTLTTYRSMAAAVDNVSTKSENYTLLSGEWRMKYVESSDLVKESDLSRMASIASWSSVELPGSWQMTGLGQAVYSTQAYPFLRAKPTTSNEKLSMPASPAVLYARDFTVPFDYMDKVLYLTVGAASSKVTLYVNGQKVGFSTDSRNPAQFEITKFVERGLNRITLQVDQFSGASWVEDQAAWRLSGINRDIYILAQPRIRMRDYLVRTTLDPTYTNGLLETSMLMKSELMNPHKITVYYDLYDRHGKLVNQASRDVEIGFKGEDTIRFTATIMGVEKWTAETPSLYTLIYRIKRDGRFTEYIARRIGFRNLEIKDDRFLINGYAEQFRGVNFEEFSPVTGNVLTPQYVWTELMKMKRLGINAIRTGGYPLPSFFYDMTDSIGFYVVSTANIDASGLNNSLSRGGSLANNPAWRDVFVDRAIATYERGKNSPSIVAWALGEDAGNGYNMYQAYLAIKARDTSRPVIYSGADAQWNTDVVCPLYPKVETLRKLRVQQPVIASRVEFDPAYWTLKNTQGAFIDRWVEPSIKVPGVKYAQLGADYRLSPRSDGRVECSSAEKHLSRIEELFAPIVVERVGKNILKITNRMQRANLSYFPMRYSAKPIIGILGDAQWESLAPVDCEPGQTVEIKLSSTAIVFEIGNLYSIKL